MEIQNTTGQQADAQTAPQVQTFVTLQGETITAEQTQLYYFCEYLKRYTDKPTRTLYRGAADGIQVSLQARAEIGTHEELYFYCGEYYDETAVEFHDLVYCEDVGGLRAQEDTYMHSDGLFYTQPEDENAPYVREYHQDGNTYFHRFTTAPKFPLFSVGLEIEKEDRSAKTSIHIDTFEQRFPKWRKEKDGSLQNYTGFELISPAFELIPEEITRYIEQSDVLKKHMNADFSTACGGHIHLSSTHESGRELFNHLRGYVHLIHALYYGRQNNDYCRAYSIERLIEKSEKYRSFNIKENRIEIRIFSAVRSVSTLNWRLRLLDYITRNPCDEFDTTANCIERMFTELTTDGSELNTLIGEVYDTPQRLNKVIERVKDAAYRYEGIELSQEKPIEQQIQVTQ